MRRSSRTKASMTSSSAFLFIHSFMTVTAPPLLWWLELLALAGLFFFVSDCRRVARRTNGIASAPSREAGELRASRSGSSQWCYDCSARETSKTHVRTLEI